MNDFFNELTRIEIIFLVIGFTGQGLFASRFIVQWLYSEKVGKSSIPVIFWYLSIWQFELSIYINQLRLFGFCSLCRSI